MKICLACGSRHCEQDWECPECNGSPEVLNGFMTFSPELAFKSVGYDPKIYHQLAKLEAQNFWFCSRNELIIWTLSKYFSDASSIFEIGCGTGFVLSAVEKAFPKMQVSGSDIFNEGLRHAASRLERTQLIQMDARQIPFAEEFDVIGAFDVIEHIEEDETVLSQLYGAVRPGGGIVITVPQHPFLWSQADEQAHHARRYTYKELYGKVQAAGFTVVRMTSFVFLLLPLMMASRLVVRRVKTNVDPLADLRIGGLSNSVMKGVMQLERLFIRCGLSLPFGGSLLIVAYKNR